MLGNFGVELGSTYYSSINFAKKIGAKFPSYNVWKLGGGVGVKLIFEHQFKKKKNVRKKLVQNFPLIMLRNLGVEWGSP